MNKERIEMFKPYDKVNCSDESSNNFMWKRMQRSKMRNSMLNIDTSSNAIMIRDYSQTPN